MSVRKQHGANMRVLMELRPALEGFAGIPQETRLLFLNLHQPGNIEIEGLVNTFHNVYRPRSGLAGARKVYQEARYVLSVTQGRWSQSRFARSRALIRHASMAFKAIAGIRGSIEPFNAALFRDFIWQNIFAKSLEPKVFDEVLARPYHRISYGWDTMHRVGGHTGFYPRLDTTNWDIALMHTPFPCRVSCSTALVIRYHDAIPIFLPQHISNARGHMWSHFQALKMNARNAWFACTSPPVRVDLLNLFPEAQSRSVVIPDIVSDAYYPERATTEELRQLLRSYVAQESEPEFPTRDHEQAFYSETFSGDYIMAVATIEPRKNYRLLISAWERFNLTSGRKIQLIIVGEMGWNYESEHRQIKAWAKRGGLFHLARMPVWALRKLYSNAIAVICPSISEGFDYAGVEAMRCDAPVIASDIPTHRAIYGEGATYFNSYSVPDFVAQLHKLIEPKRNNQIRKGRADVRQVKKGTAVADQIKKGRAVAARYTPEAIVPMWHDFFRQIQIKQKSKS